MATEEVIRLRLDLKQARKDLDRLQQDLKKTADVASRAAGRTGAAVGRQIPAAPAIGARQGVVAGAAAGAAAAGTARALAKIEQILTVLAKTVPGLSQAIARLDKISTIKTVQERVGAIAEAAGQVGLNIPEAPLRGLIRVTASAVEAGQKQRARAEELAGQVTLSRLFR